MMVKGNGKKRVKIGLEGKTKPNRMEICVFVCWCSGRIWVKWSFRMWNVTLETFITLKIDKYKEFQAYSFSFKLSVCSIWSCFYGPCVFRELFANACISTNNSTEIQPAKTYTLSYVVCSCFDDFCVASFFLVSRSFTKNFIRVSVVCFSHYSFWIMYVCVSRLDGFLALT